MRLPELTIIMKKIAFLLCLNAGCFAQTTVTKALDSIRTGYP